MLPAKPFLSSACFFVAAQRKTKKKCNKVKCSVPLQRRDYVQPRYVRQIESTRRKQDRGNEIEREEERGKLESGEKGGKKQVEKGRMSDA